MKQIWNKWMAAVVLMLGLSLSSCSDTPDAINQVDLNRCLSPLNFSASVANGKEVTFKWDVTQGSESFVIELYTDAAMSSLTQTLTVDAADVPYTTTLESDRTFYARIKAKSSRKEDSKWTIYTKKITTFEVKNALYPVVSARDAASVTITWDQSIEDADEVSHITYVPVPTPEAVEEQTLQLTAADIENGACTVSGLDASTQYIFTLYFKSASRGEVAAWTMPDLSGMTEVATVDALKQALTDGAAKILVKYNDGAAYDLGAFVTLTKAVALYGEQTPAGKRPSIRGNFQLGEGASFYAEGLSFGQRENPDVDDQTLIRIGVATTYESIEMVNCEVYGYTKGILYSPLANTTINTMRFSSLLAHNIGEGQDTFDMRQGSYGSLTIENSSFYNGCRTFVRADAATAFTGDIKVNNNFFYKVSTTTNGNNGGIFYVRSGSLAAIEAKNNVFVEMTGGSTKSGFVCTDSKAFEPTAIANNHFYNCTSATWFTRVDQSAATTSGGSILTSDPCVNSAALNFTFSNDVLIGKQAGDPRWWASAGPVIPEELVTLAEGHVWDFSDAAYYTAGDVTTPTVSGNLLFAASESAPLTITSKAVVAYNQASTVGLDGIPTLGYLAFRVSTPGSLILKPLLSDNGTVNDCFNVIVNGKACGSAYAGSEDDLKQKIVLKDLPSGSETTIYLVSTGAINLSYLEWTTDTSFSPVSVQLETPTLTLSKKSVINGAEEVLTFSWSAVERAHTYSLTFGELFTKEFSSSVLSYELTAAEVKALAAGDYAVTLQAVADPDDARYTSSELASAAFVVEFLGDGSPVEMAYPNLNSFTLINTTDKSTYWEITKNAGGVTDAAVATTGAVYTPAVVSGKVIEKIEITAIAGMTKKGWLYSSYSSKTGYTGKCSEEYVLAGTEVITVTPTEEHDRLYVAASTSGAMKVTNIKVYYKDATPVDPGTQKSYVWDFSNAGFDSYYEAIGTANNTAYAGTWDDLTITAGGSSIKVGTSSDVRYVQTGGAGDTTKRVFSFKTKATGTLKVTSSNTSDAAATDRMVAVVVGDAEPVTQVGGVASSAPATLSYTITAATEKTVYIYSTTSGLRFYKIEFEVTK